MKIIAKVLIFITLTGCVKNEFELKNKVLRIKNTIHKNKSVFIYDKGVNGKLIKYGIYENVFFDDKNIFINKLNHIKVIGEYDISIDKHNKYLKIKCSDSIFNDTFLVKLIQKDTILQDEIKCKYSKLFLKSKTTEVEFHEIIQCNVDIMTGKNIE